MTVSAKDLYSEVEKQRERRRSEMNALYIKNILKMMITDYYYYYYFTNNIS